MDTLLRYLPQSLARATLKLPRPLIWVLGALGLLLLIVIVAAYFLDEPLRRQTETRINAALKGYTVRIGRLDFHPIDFSLDLELFAFVPTTDFNEFLAVQEDVLLRLMDIVEASGSGFAFPSQTLYLGRDGGVDHERTREAEQTVRTWREEGSLPFPDFDPATVTAAEDTLDYPPRGSVAGSAPATDRV